MQEPGIEVDWRRPGPFTAQERRQIDRWYSELHGEGDLSLSGFMTFWMKHGEETFKRYRRLLQAAFVGGIPNENVSFLLFLHSYVVDGYEPGVVYEVIGCHKTGITKQQVLDTIALAFVHGGPMGMNGIASGTDAYLDKWTTDPPYDGKIWPDGWTIDGAAFKSGLDFSKPGMTATESESLCNWYKANEGEVPNYVPFLAKWNPEALKALRARYEGAVHTLPKQLIAMMMFHTAALQRTPAAMRRYAFQARRYGVTRMQMVELITFLLIYTGDLSSELMTGAVADLIERWEER